MPGFMPGIHVLKTSIKKDMDGRDIGERKRRRSSNGYARPWRINMRPSNVKDPTG